MRKRSVAETRVIVPGPCAVGILRGHERTRRTMARQAKQKKAGKGSKAKVSRGGRARHGAHGQRAARQTARDLMLRAIDLAGRCISEPGRTSPRVAAIVARDGVVVGEAYR